MPLRLPKTLVSRNLYHLLEIENFSSAQAVKKGFRNLALKYHPDRFPASKEAENRFLLAVEAYQILRDSDKKSIYDSWLRNRRIPSHAKFSGQAEGPLNEKVECGIRRYVVDPDRNCFVDTHRENFVEFLNNLPRVTRRPPVYNSRHMGSAEFETFVEEGRSRFQEFLDSRPRYGKSTR